MDAQLGGGGGHSHTSKGKTDLIRLREADAGQGNLRNIVPKKREENDRNTHTKMGVA